MSFFGYGVVDVWCGGCLCGGCRTIEIGYKVYPNKMGGKVFRAISEVYLTERFLKSYISDLQHTFTSSEGKSESYNETFENSDEVNFFETFLLFNPHVGGHFHKKNSNDGAHDDTDDGDDGQSSQMHELSWKSLSAGYYNHQVYNEMKDRNIAQTEVFGPKINPSDSRKQLTYKDSVEAFMRRIDEKRRDELYEHTDDDCSIACKKSLIAF